MILGVNGKSHPLLKTPTFWDRTLTNVIINAYGSFIAWDDLHKQLTRLEALSHSHPGPFSWDSTVPIAYSDQLHHFKYHLQRATNGLIQLLKEGVAASPPLRSYFVREPQDQDSTIIKVRLNGGIGKNELLRIFDTLWDDEQRFLYGLSNILDELDRVLHKDAT